MSDETKACPNRDCDHTGDFTEIVWGETGHGLGVWVRCDCGAAGPFTLLCDSFSDVAKAEAEARRLWNDLPRATGPGEATRSLMEAMRDAIDGWEERDYLCFNHESGFGETVDRSTVAAALRECGMEAGS